MAEGTDHDFSVSHDVDPFLLRLEGTPALVNRRNRGAMEKVVKYGEGQAKENVPRRSGQLFSSIHSEVTGGGPELRGQIATNVYYGRFVEFGTGLFTEIGPRHRITPTSAKAMAWPAKATLAGRKRKGSGMVFARSTKGMKPQHFMEPAAEAVLKDGPLFFQAEAVAIRDFLTEGSQSAT